MRFSNEPQGLSDPTQGRAADRTGVLDRVSEDEPQDSEHRNGKSVAPSPKELSELLEQVHPSPGKVIIA